MAETQAAKRQLAAASLLFFLVEFGTFQPGYSLETVYITPFFIRLETPWLLDSVIWLAPALFLLTIPSLTRRTRLFSSLSRSRKGTVSVLVAFSLVGLIVLIAAAVLGEFHRGEDTGEVLVLAFVGFLVMDVGLTMLDGSTVELLEEGFGAIRREEIREWSSGWKHFGRITAYFLASCDALQLGSRYIYFVLAI